jgi:sugar/nucleoside kinase (ribokinase family)
MDDKRVLCVGGANGEKIVHGSPEATGVGGKVSTGPIPLYGGGSAINHACRLLALRIAAYPVVAFADDYYGTLVRDALASAAKTGKLKPPVIEPTPQKLGLRTGFTTVTSPRVNRRITTEVDDRLTEYFGKTVIDRFVSLLDTNDSRGNVGMVMIGHIHADRERKGGITQRILSECGHRNIPVYANLGRSQYEMGKEAWEPFLTFMTYFQLDVSEVRRFFSNGHHELEEIFGWFQSKTNLIVTMAELGAIVQRKDSKEITFVPGRSLHLSEVRDTTGAGDAFAAGFVSKALVNRLDSADAFEEAARVGASMGAYACTNEGGANKCPNRSELEEFSKTHGEVRSIERLPFSVSTGRLREYDLVFRDPNRR